MSAPPSIKDLIHPFDLEEIVSSVQIRPDGIKLENGSIYPRLEAEVLSFSPARTRYKKHHPVCRSIDGIQTIHAEGWCSSCALRKDCTGQIRLDLIHRSAVIRLLLSHASMRNFMLFLSTLKQQKIQLKAESIIIKVLNRGHWGELKFHLQATDSTADKGLKTNPTYYPTQGGLHMTNNNTNPYNIIPRNAAEMEEIVIMIRLHLYNEGLPCGAKAIRQQLEDACETPLPSLSTINRILRHNSLTHGRTGHYD